jgi:putative YhdH/YhfP family quinone oxidoreductase
LVEKTAAGEAIASVVEKTADDLPAGDVLIRVRWSSLNYKDALAATGHPGVARRFPHVPGIDAAGEVAHSSSSQFAPGDEVLVTGYDLGAKQWGGWAGYVRVPADWVVPLPEGLSLRESMVLGTAGFTAALCVGALRDHRVEPGDGEVLVTGASGGVGGFAVMLLARLGYQVVAASGKRQVRQRLQKWGAARVIGRDEVCDEGAQPLRSSRWSAAVDTVGGKILATVLRETRLGGVVAACGMAGGADLSLTVFPFILRGITLAGIDSAWRSHSHRLQIWRTLSGDWRLDNLDSLAASIGLNQLRHHTAKMLEGQLVGRIVVAPTVGSP